MFDISKLATKSDLVSLKAGVDKSDIYKLKTVPTNLSSLKSKVGKSDIGKLETTPVDLSKLSNVVKNDVVKKTEYNAKKITDNSHGKCITTPEFNKLAAESFAGRLAQANLVTKADFDDKLINLN